MHRFREPDPRHHGRNHRHGGRGPDRRCVADVRKQSREAGADDETQSECSAQKPERPGALVWLRDVSDVRARNCDVSAGQAVDNSRSENVLVYGSELQLPLNDRFAVMGAAYAQRCAR